MGIVGFACVVSMMLINNNSETHDRTIEVVIGASGKTMEVMERRWQQEREDRREERAADRESIKRTWESLKEIRTAVERNTAALNEVSQSLRMVK